MTLTLSQNPHCYTVVNGLDDQRSFSPSATRNNVTAAGESTNDIRPAPIKRNWGLLACLPACQ
ncbi:hypothetical protein HJFPF1_05081 [Paramyrothecium foliicola]|nr:hypothetical protein HJFPF1_05081 [Paramyrothecium foliicola]